jgi:hypothetical protein
MKHFNFTLECQAECPWVIEIPDDTEPLWKSNATNAMTGCVTLVAHSPGAYGLTRFGVGQSSDGDGGMMGCATLIAHGPDAYGSTRSGVGSVPQQ